MFTIPDEEVTKVTKDERFTIAKMGHGNASLCGNKVTLIVPSEGRKLGERFRATANNKLIPEDVIGELKAKAEQYRNRPIGIEKVFPGVTKRRK